MAKIIAPQGPGLRKACTTRAGTAQVCRSPIGVLDSSGFHPRLGLGRTSRCPRTRACTLGGRPVPGRRRIRRSARCHAVSPVCARPSGVSVYRQTYISSASETRSRPRRDSRAPRRGSPRGCCRPRESRLERRGCHGRTAWTAWAEQRLSHRSGQNDDNCGHRGIPARRGHRHTALPARGPSRYSPWLLARQGEGQERLSLSCGNWRSWRTAGRPSRPEPSVPQPPGPKTGSHSPFAG